MLSFPLAIEQPPLLLALVITFVVAVGSGVFGNGCVGVGAGKQMVLPPMPTGKHRSGSRQSVFFSHGSPEPSGVLQSPWEPEMSQRSPSGHVSVLQHVPSVQKPLWHCAGLVQVVPVPRSGVGLGGSSVQNPWEPETRHDDPDGQCRKSQHTWSSGLQKKPAWH